MHNRNMNWVSHANAAWPMRPAHLVESVNLAPLGNLLLPTGLGHLHMRPQRVLGRLERAARFCCHRLCMGCILHGCSCVGPRRLHGVVLRGYLCLQSL
jgi:hypothetical protein